MVFHPPSFVPKLPFDPPDDISLPEFLFDPKWGRESYDAAEPPFTCGLTGKEYSATEQRDRVEDLAKGLAKELAWHPNAGSEWNKVVGIFAVNTVCAFG
jgi:ribosome assembly protein SQT1